LICNWFFGVHCVISKGTRARGTTNSHLWGKTREANTCNRCEFQTNTQICILEWCVLRSLCLQEKKSIEQTFPDGMSFSECWKKRGKEVRLKKEIRKRPILLSPFRFSRVHLKPIQEAATENFALRITAFLSYLEMLR